MIDSAKCLKSYLREHFIVCMHYATFIHTIRHLNSGVLCVVKYGKKN